VRGGFWRVFIDFKRVLMQFKAAIVGTDSFSSSLNPVDHS